MVKILKTSFAIICFIAATAVAADAGPITYSVLVNTSSISGTNGNLDFQFNPGPSASDPAIVTISNFAGGALGSADIVGDVAGALPGTVTIRNTNALNDYTNAFTFGNSLSFLLNFNGPALTSPSHSVSAGSVFAFTLFNSDFSATLLSNDLVNGVLVEGDVDLNGIVTITNFSTNTTTVGQVAAVPEPATLLLLGSGLVGLARRSRKRG